MGWIGWMDGLWGWGPHKDGGTPKKLKCFDCGVVCVCVCIGLIRCQMKNTIGASRLDTLRMRSSRPGFMEHDMVVPSGGGVWNRDKDQDRLPRYRRKMFPLKDDAGYIGYLSDDEVTPAVVHPTPTYDGGGGWGVGDGDVGRRGSGGSGRRGGGVSGVAEDIVEMRRRELVGSDISFTGTLIGIIVVVLLFILAVSPWGVPPPNGGNYVL
jgi:hypothetical protein